MRVRWQFLFAFLFVGAVAVCCLAVTSNNNVVVPQNNNPVSQRNFQNVFSAINAKPTIFTGAGVPTIKPVKIGDLYINTSAGTAYISTGTVNSGSWLQI